MARQNRYQTDTNVVARDKWLSTDFETGQPKNIEAQGLAEYLAGSGTADGTGTSSLYTFIRAQDYVAPFPAGRMFIQGNNDSTFTPSGTFNLVVTNVNLAGVDLSGIYNQLIGSDFKINDPTDGNRYFIVLLNSVTVSGQTLVLNVNFVSSGSLTTITVGENFSVSPFAVRATGSVVSFEDENDASRTLASIEFNDEGDEMTFSDGSNTRVFSGGDPDAIILTNPDDTRSDISRKSVEISRTNYDARLLAGTTQPNTVYDIVDDPVPLISDGGVSLVNGNVSLPNSGGIIFGTTSSTTTTGAASTSKTLDDYEEGTWTPDFTSSRLSATAVGTYTKVGDIVTIIARFTNTANTGNAVVFVEDLPFTPSANNTSTGGVSVWGISGGNLFGNFAALAVNRIEVISLTTDSFTTADFITVSLTYQTTA